MRSKPTKSTSIKLAQDLVRFLEKRLSKKLTSVVLFGSVVREEVKRGSDIDVLIVLDFSTEEESEGLDAFFDATIDFEDTYPTDRHIHFIPFTKEEAKVTHPFYLDMVENSVIVFDRDDFVKKKLERLKERMKELGTRKVFLPDGKWYWQLKPGAKPGEEIEL
ncbi:MAG TPA: nucleotidyltransferase domain-containing protein [Thermodesulfobacteriota bacterium]|nr:nucleotidyltransferase domain-containing protein [Thermodesulfobacteriota bacterium]